MMMTNEQVCKGLSEIDDLVEKIKKKKQKLVKLSKSFKKMKERTAQLLHESANVVAKQAALQLAGQRFVNATVLIKTT